MSAATQNYVDELKAENVKLKCDLHAALAREAALGAALREAQCITAEWHNNEESIGGCLNKLDHWASYY